MYKTIEFYRNGEVVKTLRYDIISFYDLIRYYIHMVGYNRILITEFNDGKYVRSYNILFSYCYIADK